MRKFGTLKDQITIHDPDWWKPEVTDTERLARWMIKHGFATGHGDSVEDLLKELSWQVKELRDRIWELERADE